MVSFYERYFNRARLEEAHEIAKNVIARGVGINKNDDLALDESFLK